MSTKRLIVITIIIFVSVFVLEAVIHGVGLREIYESTKDTWRPEEEMNAKFPFMLFSQFLFSLVFSVLFCLGYEAKGIGEGVRYGLYVGLFTGLVSFSFYAYITIPFVLALLWLLAAIVECIVLGVIASIVASKVS